MKEIIIAIIIYIVGSTICLMYISKVGLKNIIKIIWDGEKK